MGMAVGAKTVITHIEETKENLILDNRLIIFCVEFCEHHPVCFV